MKKKKLGHWQAQMLKKIADNRKGISCYKIMSLKGKALDYRSKYTQSLHNAIYAHNNREIENSPISVDNYIQIGQYGVRGGYGFRVVPRILL